MEAYWPHWCISEYYWVYERELDTQLEKQLTQGSLDTQLEKQLTQESLDTQLEKQLTQGILDTKTPWKRECSTNTLLETKPKWRRVIDPKIFTWIESHFRGWTKP